MERLTIDMEGARYGELSAASLQMGDDTIAIQRIATMSVEAHAFLPFDTPGNQQTKGVYASLFVFCLFIALMGVSYWGLMASGTQALIAIGIAAGFGLLALIFGVKTLQYARKLKKRVPYYRLLIGTSDGRQIPLVDDNRDVLMKIRDIVRHKMDTGDTEMTGNFDLNLDIVDLKQSPNEVPVEEDEQISEILDAVSETADEPSDESAPSILFGNAGSGLKDAS